MTTLRIARRRRFVQLDSRSMNDERLSFRARGVLAWLLDKPDDWTVNAAAIANGGKEGRDAIRKALAELESAGYLRRRKWRRDDGTYASETLVCEHPEIVQESLLDSDQGGLSATVDQPRPTSDGNSVALHKTFTQDETKSARSARASESPMRLAAKRLLDVEWERRKQAGETQPASYIGATKIVEKLLAAGHSTNMIAEALIVVPTISIGAMEMQLNKNKQQHRANGPRLSKSRQNVDAFFDNLQTQQGEDQRGLGTGEASAVVHERDVAR